MKNLLTAICILCCLRGIPGVYRHDRPESAYAALAAQPQFDCVGQLFHEGKPNGSCVLIANRYVLTARHCCIEWRPKMDTVLTHGAPKINTGAYCNQFGIAGHYTVTFGAKTYKVKALMVYPVNLETPGRDDCDLALLELEEPVADISAAILNTSFDELHADVTGVGYGASGPANKPDLVSLQNKKLAGENVIDTLMGYAIDGRTTVLWCDFDSPTDATLSKMGSATPRDLEYICSGGDSGGGLFRKGDTGWTLVGICHTTMIEPESIIKNGYYGTAMGWTRVSVFAGWITQNMK